MMSSKLYNKAFLHWRPMEAYWPQSQPAQTEGPEVVFAWKEQERWRFGVGYGSWPLRGTDEENEWRPVYYVGEWEIRPACFAYISPPVKRGKSP